MRSLLVQAFGRVFQGWVEEIACGRVVEGGARPPSRIGVIK